MALLHPLQQCTPSHGLLAGAAVTPGALGMAVAPWPQGELLVAWLCRAALCRAGHPLQCRAPSGLGAGLTVALWVPEAAAPNPVQGSAHGVPEIRICKAFSC